MHMRACGASGGADLAHYVATSQLLANLGVNFRHMAKHADEALAVIHEHRVAIEEVVADQDHFTGRRGFDGRTCRYGKVEASVGVAFFTVEKAAHAKLAGQRSVDRFVQQQVTRGVGAESTVSLDLNRQLVVDALDVSRVGVDLALVLQRDALLGVFLVAHREAQFPRAADD